MTAPGAPTGPRLASPALADADLPAFELKFLLAEPEARALEDCFRTVLAPDPYALASGGVYRVTSTYFDTPALAVYHRSPGHRTHKFRLRRYGHEELVFLERKSKQGGRVWKRRTAVPSAHLTGLDSLNGESSWFATALETHGLRPVCRVAYDRTALVGTGPTGPIRFTIDRAARGQPTAQPDVEPIDEGHCLLDGSAIVEFKFLSALPPLFKDAIAERKLTPAGVSKYRRCIEAAGLVAR